MFQSKRLRMHSSMIALFLWASIPLLGQIGPIEKHSVHNDVSAPLAEMIRDRANAGPEPKNEPKEAEKVRRINLPLGLKPADEPDTIQQRTVVPAGAALAAGQAAPISGLGFDGLGNGSFGFGVGGAPSDTNGSAGLTQYVQWVNTSFAIFNKANGALIAGPTAGNTLWSGFGGGCQSNNNGDPVVLYDKQANRWVFAQFSVSTTPFLQCVAVSTTSDATGTYNRYAFQYSNFDDYPKMGIWPDAYYTTFNMFASGGGFVGADFCAYDRNAMLNGQPATQVCFQQGSSVGSTLPADVESLTAPPAGSPNFLLSFGSNNLNLFKFHVDFNTPANSTLTGPTVIPVAGFTALCNGGTCVPQAGTTQQLDTLADRLMFRLSYRNFGGHESLVVNHSVAAGSSGGVRWYELQNPNGTVTLAQQSTFAPDSNFRWMGSIASDRAGDMAMGYSVSSASINPSIAFTGRLASDPASTMQAETTIINGTGSQTGGLSRWGDYSAISVDPIDDCTFWYTTEYLKSSGSFNWNTRIANFRFPSCAGSPLTSWLQGDGPHFIYLDANQHLRQIFDEAFTTWSTEDLTNTTGAPAAALQSALTSWVQSDGPHFVYEDANQHLNQLFFINGAWHAQDLTNATGAPLATPGSALTTWLDSAGCPHFVYEDVNQHLRVFFFLNGAWQTQDLTSTTGAPPAIPGTALASWVQGDGPHFVYLDGRQHLHQIFNENFTTWNTEDLTNTTGAPLATPGSGLTAWQDSVGPHFVFQDTNQHMNQMFFALSNVTWITQDLTALTGANLATPQSGFASWLQSDGPHFIYGDANQHINQMFFNNSAWHAENLTNTTGAPLSALGSALTVWQQSDGPHFVYQDVNQHTDQIFFLLNQGIWQTQDLTNAAGAPLAE